jgi:hypothetical protein
MKLSIYITCFMFVFMAVGPVIGQTVDSTKTADKIVDVVWLKDGSKLSGYILKWELARGMEFKLITGAEVILPKDQITRVYQDLPFASQLQTDQSPYVRKDRSYRFREEGIYNTFSCFLNFSSFGGAGVHYSIGYRFSRMLGVGIGIGIESNDFNNSRGIVPLYAEARGFFVPKKISPYYAFKIGYGFAQKAELAGTIDAKGGFMVSPELGVRFGGRAVNYYMGFQYKIQNAQYTNTIGWDGQGTYTDVVSYRRVDFRAGLLF